MTKHLSEEQLIKLLLIRLERISADSYLAHRASGMRGALIKILENIEYEKYTDKESLHLLLTESFKILENAAKERPSKLRYDGWNKLTT